ncbi:unnamed protein product [Rhizopus stolonifer]
MSQSPTLVPNHSAKETNETQIDKLDSFEASLSALDTQESQHSDFVKLNVDTFTLNCSMTTTTATTTSSAAVAITHTETTQELEASKESVSATTTLMTESKKQSEEFQKLELTDSFNEKTTHVLEAHEAPDAHGFQKLDSVVTLSQENKETSYYNPTAPYDETHPRAAPNHPLLSREKFTEIQPSRSFLLRALLGPVKVPVFSYVAMLIMVAMLIYELVRMHQLTGSVIETSPFNPMIGPSFQVLVNEGARFTPCIRTVPSFPTSTVISDCYASSTDTCTLEELCGFGGFSSGSPDQSFRLVLPIFMHAGILHFFINMLTHLRLGVDLEQTLGTPRYALLYMASGIWGFVLSAMLSQNTSASTGCSGALFGLIGYMFVDILVNWKILAHPVRDLMSLLMSTIISLVIGLFPGLDNFAHIGGFVIGLLMGMAVAPMRPMASSRVKIVTWVLRVAALVGLIVIFAVTVNELYSVSDPSTICPNCKYLSCIPVSNWCDPV